MRRILITLAAAALALGLARAAPAAAQESDHARLMQCAEATWASFAAMVDTSSMCRAVHSRCRWRTSIWASVAAQIGAAGGALVE